MSRFLPLVASILLSVLGGLAVAAPAPLTPEQQQAVDKLKAKGASVVSQAADTDALVANLGLAGKAVGDDELALLKALPKIVELDLHGTAVTDAGLANLEGMKELTRLRLDHTKVGDGGLTHLKGLSNLVYLNLFDTSVTDAGVDTLKEMKGLKRIFLYQTKVTAAGADTLRKSLPGSTVNRGEGLDAPTTTTSPTTLAAAPTPPPAPAVPEFKTDAEGFIRDWLVLAPFPYPGRDGAEQIDRELVAGEKDLKPKAGEKAKAGEKEVAWKAVQSPDYFFDVNQSLGGQKDNSVAYVVAYVASDSELTDTQLRIGSDDQAKVYLNGREVLASTATHGVAKDQYRAAGLTLRKGTNVLVFKIVNQVGAWQGCARFCDKDGAPLKDLKIRQVPG